MRPAWIALCAALGLWACAESPPGPTHLLLITLDTLRADSVSYAGGRPGLTPHIDRLAADGAVYTDTWAPRGQTWPALASLLTGLPPLAHGVRENGFALSERVPTLAELMRRGERRTGAFLSNGCEAWGLERFDYLECTQRRGELEGDQSRLQYVWDQRAVESALEWIRADETPFFAWVHLYDAHKPFPTIDELRERYLDPGYAGPLRAPVDEVAVRHSTALHERIDEFARAGRVPEPADLEALRAYYDAGVYGVDRHVGALIAGLEAQGLLEDTLVVVTADHGEELFDHGAYPYHGAAIHGSTLRVPLVLRHPASFAAGTRETSPATLMDLVPTICQLFDLPPPGELEGRSLIGRAAGSADEAPAQLSELVDLDLTARPPRVRGEFFALRRGRWRLVWNPQQLRIRKPPYTGDPDPEAGLLHSTALYDLESDSTEQRDLSASEPGLVEELRSALEAEVARQREGALPPILPDAQVIETLEALGYLGGGN